MNARDNSAGPDTAGDAAQANLGEMLRHARELRDLSIDDLARCLRLEPRIIQRLEGNQFEDLPAPAFVRGYVRSIAKELDVDAGPLIAVLDLRFHDGPPELSDFESRAPVPITTDSQIMRYTTLAVMIVMVVLVALWWQSRPPAVTDDTDSVGPVDKAVQTPATDPLPYSYRVIEHSDSPFYRAPTPPKPAVAAVSEDAASTAPATTRAGDEAVNPEPSATPDTGNATARPAADGDIVIRASGDAWIEVRDAAGARLYYDLVRAGREVRLNGTPPYRATIGNAAAVEVFYDGAPITLDNVNSNGIARVEFGPRS